ncbi:MAG: carbonic anhydrase, partial [Nocardioidaceae bacterium]
MNQTSAFDDLLAANRDYAHNFTLAGVPGVAGAGVFVLTCMDSRIDPLTILGLSAGDAKVVRNPGGRVDGQALEAMVLGVHLLAVERVLVIVHTRCAMSSSTQQQV